MGELTRPSTAIRLFFLVARPQGVAAQPLVLKALEKEFPSRCNHILQRTPSQSFLINLLVRPRAFIVGAVARDIKPREISVPHQEALGCQSTSIRNQRSAVHHPSCQEDSSHRRTRPFSCLCRKDCRSGSRTLDRTSAWSVLILTDLNGVPSDQKATRVMKETAVFDKPCVKKSAWGGSRESASGVPAEPEELLPRRTSGSAKGKHKSQSAEFW
jgi:hypothetical protein